MYDSGDSRRENADARHCEERSDEAIQLSSLSSHKESWIASLRSQ
jgi:hypothetical protein